MALGIWGRTLERAGFAAAFGLAFALAFASASAYALEPTDKWEGSINYAATGGTFLEDTCQASSFGCIPGSFDGQGDRVVSTGTATLYGVPDGVHVVKAYLVWMGSILHGSDTPDNQVTLQPPLGQTYPVIAGDEQLEEIVYNDTDAGGMPATYHFFNYRVDITEIIRRHVVTEDKPLNGEYTVTGFSAYVGEPYLSRTTGVGGWSLVIVYSAAFMQPKRIYYYTDFRKIHDEVVVLNPSGFEVPDDPEAKITFFLGEGDQGIVGTGLVGTHNEELRFQGTVLTDACNTGDNAYNSTVNTNIRPNEAPCRINQYSVDLDTFDISALLGRGDTEAEVFLSLGQDQVFTNFLILSIDTKLPDFDIPDEPEKGASVPAGGALYPGQEFKYYIYVQNNGDDQATNVRVRDALPPDVTYLPGGTVVVEPNGERRAIPDAAGGAPPCLTGIAVADVMPPGEAFRRTVEIGVRLNRIEEGVTKETIVENTAEIISGNGDVYFTNGGVPVQHTVQLESFEGTLHFTKGPKHPTGRFVMAGDKDVLAAHITLKSLGGDVQLSSLRFTPLENTDAEIVAKARLFWDKDEDGVVDDSDAPLGGDAAWQGGGIAFANFAALPQVAANQQATLLLQVDIADNAWAGATTTLELLSDGVVVRGFTDGLPFAAAKLNIPAAETGLSMELGFGNPPDGFVSPGATASVMQLLVRAYGEGATIGGLTLSAEGSLHDPAGISQLVLYNDMNGDGLHQPGEMQLGSPATFADNDGTAAFSGFTAPVSAGGEAHLLIVATFSDQAADDQKFRLRISNDEQLAAGGAAVAGAPVEGSLFTVKEGEVQECLEDADCAYTLGRGWICDELQGICIESGVLPDEIGRASCRERV